jgi:integrase
VIQQGQVFKLRATCADGEPLWAYRYRVAGRGSARLQVGGSGARPRRRGRLICVWRLTVPEGHRFEATQALRQVLNRAVAWKLLDDNPAKRGVPNPGRRCREQRPFESWAQIRSVTERLGPMLGPMVVFAAATGLRPSELFALEQGDVEHGAGVVQIRRAYANGRVKETKTRLSRRAVPLQAIALEALAQLPPRADGPLLFPNARGGHHDFRNFNRRHWKPVQKTIGIEPARDLYDLRHTYATFALRAGVPVFALSRFMGTSIAMIDLHYGHLAIDSYPHAVSLLDALALERAVDAGWTPARRPATPHSDTISGPNNNVFRRTVDARWTSRPEAI